MHLAVPLNTWKSFEIGIKIRAVSLLHQELLFTQTNVLFSTLGCISSRTKKSLMSMEHMPKGEEIDFIEM